MSGSHEVIDLAPRKPDIPELPVAQVVQCFVQALTNAPGTK
jgi:hypothetical protein